MVGAKYSLREISEPLGTRSSQRLPGTVLYVRLYEPSPVLQQQQQGPMPCGLGSA